MAKYASHVSTRKTSQSEPIPGKKQVQNQAGGFSFQVDCWARLDRFLVLGNEGGSYYANEKKMTVENAGAILECHNIDPQRTIDRIVEMSTEGRAPKNDPAIFALAMLSKDRRALDAMSKVCRIGTHLFQFFEAAKSFRGRGRAFNQAIRNWYLGKGLQSLTYQLAKYQSRNGWSHRDILRLTKPKPKSVGQSAAFGWSVGKDKTEFLNTVAGLEYLDAFEAAKKAKNKKEIVKLIRDHDLVRECIPTEFLNEVSVWEALLEKMPLTAMIRNLNKMTAVGLLKPLSAAVESVCDKLSDVDAMKKQRVHPLNLLVAQKIYGSGKGDKGSLTWSPVAKVVDALDESFYTAFKAVEPTGKRWMLALDVSGSMGYSTIAGMPGITPRVGSAAMAMITAAVERQHMFVAFQDSLTELAISPKQRLNDVCDEIDGMEFGSTDCAQPMLHAIKQKLEVDMFVVYTDSETWFGKIHPCQALEQYRQKTGIPAKLIVVGMVANEFTIADPNDAGMMDVVGFDTAVPQIMSQFAIG
jgi:60 kDa SS-A/Ro ribonucleoprotein